MAVQELFCRILACTSTKELQQVIGDASKTWNRINWTTAHRYPAFFIPIYRTLKQLRPNSVLGALSSLEPVHEINQKKNENFLASVEELGGAFERASVPALFMKGAAYLLTIPTDERGSRCMNDIDVLIQNGHLEGAEKVLSTLGYIEDYGQKPVFLQEGGRDLFEKEYCHYVYSRKGVYIELHWKVSVLENSAFDETLWRTSKNVARESCQLRVPSVEGALLCTTLNFLHDVLTKVPNHRALGTVERGFKAVKFLNCLSDISFLFGRAGREPNIDQVEELLKASSKPKLLRAFLIFCLSGLGRKREAHRLADDSGLRVLFQLLQAVGRGNLAKQFIVLELYIRFTWSSHNLDCREKFFYPRKLPADLLALSFPRAYARIRGFSVRTKK